MSRTMAGLRAGQAKEGFVMTSKPLLLTALLLGPSYGLELIQRVDELTNGLGKIKEGSAYPTLRAMERDGLVKVLEGEALPQRGGRPRIYYQLTESGQKEAMELREQLNRLTSFEPTPNLIGGDTVEEDLRLAARSLTPHLQPV